MSKFKIENLHLQLKIHDSLKSKEFTVLYSLKNATCKSTFNMKHLKFKIWWTTSQLQYHSASVAKCARYPLNDDDDDDMRKNE